MVPIPDSAMLSFLDMGVSAEWVLRMCLLSINGVMNRGVSIDGSIQIDPEFTFLVKSFQRLQATNAIRTWFLEVEGQSVEYIAFENRANEPTIKADIATVKDLLGLDPILAEYRIGFTPDGERDAEIRMYGRSLGPGSG
jgi:hypothetical protein